jgi:hypothetical protein
LLASAFRVRACEGETGRHNLTPSDPTVHPACVDAVRNAKKGTTVGEAIAARENPLASGPGKPKGSKGGNQYTVAFATLSVEPVS